MNEDMGTIDLEKLIHEDTDNLGLTDKERADFDIFKEFKRVEKDE